MMTSKMGERDSREEIIKAFKLFDDDNTGFITLKNLKRVAKELGENLTDEELQVGPGFGGGGVCGGAEKFLGACGQGAAFACLPTAHPAPAQAHVSPGNLGNLPEPPKQCGTVLRHRTQATAGKPHLHSERAG